MDNKELSKMTGQESEERVVAYKLNEIRMSGDTGAFTYLELLGTKGEDGKYPSKDIGAEFTGVILKMRWRLFKYDEMGDGTPKVTSTSEFDNKNTDSVYVFGTGEKGLAVSIKEKYQLGTQRVLYVYLPKRDEIVRVIVKPSALTSEKNPNGEKGLFTYIDEYRNSGDYVHEYQTKFGSVYREDLKNKRKSYYAMTFERGDHLRPESIEKVSDMIKQVHEKTTGTNFVEEYVPPPKEEPTYPVEDINPDDVPF